MNLDTQQVSKSGKSFVWFFEKLFTFRLFGGKNWRQHANNLCKQDVKGIKDDGKGFLEVFDYFPLVQVFKFWVDQEWLIFWYSLEVSQMCVNICETNLLEGKKNVSFMSIQFCSDSCWFFFDFNRILNFLGSLLWNR